MNFGSKYVYNYSDSEEECVSDDEYAEGMTSYIDEVQSTGRKENASKGIGSRLMDFGRRLSGGGRAGAQAAASSSDSFNRRKKHHHWLSLGEGKDNKEKKEVPKGKRWRRADTNVISVKFDTITAAMNMHTGDPYYCSACDAILAKGSTLEEVQNQGTRNWRCDFCNQVDTIDLEDEEIPQSEDVTFMLKPAPTTSSSGKSGQDESLVIFCIDTSGSMCVTSEVPGNINLRGSHLDRLQSLNDTRESQFLPHQRRNVTYVSRLQSVQAAVDHQLQEMQQQHPNRRVVLVYFNSEVTVLGDGSSEPVHISGDKLQNKDELIKIGSEIEMPKQVKDSRNLLGSKLFDLEEGGQTALGPALVVAVSVACQVPGSKVIICTDGMANVGLGTLDSQSNEAAFQEASSFYDDVSQQASEKGISVSVISIKGTDCKMVELGRVADATGGQVNIVDPLKLTEEFGNILADPIIATNVTATLQLHKGLYFRYEESDESKVTRFVGNVTKESEISFEYGIRKEYKRKAAQSDAKLRMSTVVEEGPVYDNPKNTRKEELQATATGEEPVYDNPVNKSEKDADKEIQDPVYDNPGTSKESHQSTSKSTTEKIASCSTENFQELQELPFQLRVTYTDLDGAQAMRVITQRMPITNDRMQAESAMNMAAVGSHATKVSADFALQGDYTTSRLNAFMYQRLMHRKASTRSTDSDELQVYGNFYNCALPMENRMQAIQGSEIQVRGSTYSDDEDDSDDDYMSRDTVRAACSAPTAMKKPKKSKPTLFSRKESAPKKAIGQKSMARRMECDDDSANMFYANANVSSKKMMSKKE